MFIQIHSKFFEDIQPGLTGEWISLTAYAVHSFRTDVVCQTARTSTKNRVSA